MLTSCTFRTFPKKVYLEPGFVWKRDIPAISSHLQHIASYRFQGGPACRNTRCLVTGGRWRWWLWWGPAESPGTFWALWGGLKMFNDFHLHRRVMHQMPQGKPSSAPSIFTQHPLCLVSLQVSIVYVYSIQNQIGRFLGQSLWRATPIHVLQLVPVCRGISSTWLECQSQPWPQRRLQSWCKSKKRRQGPKKWLLKGFPQCRNTDLERHDS